MPYTFKLSALAAVMLVGSSCGMFSGNRDTLQSNGDGAQKESLTVLIKADPQLNRFEKNPHTLFLCLYQLKDPDGFNQLAQERDGVPKLMECGRFDPTVASAGQLVVQPGQETSEVRARAEGARYFGVAAGYYGMGKQKVTVLTPLLPTKGGSEPHGGTLRLDLGPYQISDLKVVK